jgi:hypothetical protein
MCALKYYDPSYGDELMFGVTLNTPINQNKPFLQALGIDRIDFCDDALFWGKDEFMPCSGDPRVHYNNYYWMVIYSKNLLTSSMYPGPGWTAYMQAQFTQFIKNPVQQIIDYLLGLPGGVQYPEEGGDMNLEFLQKTNRFNRLYVEQKGGRSITAINEQVNLTDYSSNAEVAEYIAINYNGFTGDICDTVDAFNKNYNDIFRGWAGSDINEINCTPNGPGSWYVVSRRPSGVTLGNFKDYSGTYRWIGEELWDDLTVKLRVE